MSYVRRAFVASFLFVAAVTGNAFATEPGLERAIAPPTLPAVNFKQAVEKLWPYSANGAAINREYVSGKYDAAFQLADAASSTDDFVATYWRGRLYLEGKGVGQDVSKGIALLIVAEAAGIGYASLSLWRLYSQGQLMERQVDLANEYHARWVAFEIAYAERCIEDIPMWKAMMNLELAGTLRYWKQRLRYLQKLSVFAEKERIRRQLVDAESLGAAIKIGSLPLKCRPGSPPGLMMARAKVDELSGDILVFVGETLQPDGVLVGNVSDPRLTIAAMRTFDVAFQSPGCKFPSELVNRIVQIPFLFKLQ